MHFWKDRIFCILPLRKSPFHELNWLWIPSRKPRERTRADFLTEARDEDRVVSKESNFLSSRWLARAEDNVFNSSCYAFHFLFEALFFSFLQERRIVLICFFLITSYVEGISRSLSCISLLFIGIYWNWSFCRHDQKGGSYCPIPIWFLLLR